MTIAPIRPTQSASLPTLTEVHARRDWVSVSWLPCECDPAIPYQCTRCLMADDRAFDHAQDI